MSNHASVVSLYGDEQADSDRPFILPDANYKAVFKGFERNSYRFYGNQLKLELKFCIVDPPEYFGKVLSRHFNVKKLTKRGSVSSGWRSDLMREYTNCFGAPQRKDRICLTKFNNKVFQIRTRTVTKDHKTRNIHSDLQYSIVAEILGVTTL